MPVIPTADEENSSMCAPWDEAKSLRRPTRSRSSHGKNKIFRARHNPDSRLALLASTASATQHRRKALSRSQKPHLAVALPYFDITAIREIGQNLFCIVVVHAGQIDGGVGLSVFH